MAPCLLPWRLIVASDMLVVSHTQPSLRSVHRCRIFRAMIGPTKNRSGELDVKDLEGLYFVARGRV